MTKKFFTPLFIFVAFTAAAQTDTLQGDKLEEVVITANKYPQKQSTTGKVVTVITKEQIEKGSGRTLPQLLNEQAGITINGAYNNLGANQTVYIRGAGSGRALILLDGIPVNDPTLIPNDFDINLFSVNNIERIEIARGAQSTLYGSDAIAGVVNIITVKNDISRPINFKATATAGSYGTFRGNLNLYGKENKFSYNARYTKLSSKGFSAAFDSTVSKVFDNDGYNSDVASILLQYQVNKSLSLKTFSQYSRYDTDLDAAAFVDEKDYSVSNKSLVTGAGFQFKKNRVSITGNYQYNGNQRNYVNDSTDKPSFTTFSTDDYSGKSHFTELYSTVKLNGKISSLIGIDYRKNRMHSNYFSLSSYGPYTSSFNDTSLDQASLYASLFYRGGKERLNIEVGGRFNRHSRYGNNQTFTFNPSFSITNRFRLFASVASGFKAPTLFQLFSTYGRQDLKPEHSYTYEAGLHYVSEAFNSRVVYFHRVIRDGIDFDNINFKYYNYMRQTVNGVELETKVEPAKNFTVTANYTYLKPAEYSQSRITFKDTTYRYLLRRPQHNFTVSAGYQFSNALFMSVGGKYVGSRHDVGGYGANDFLLDNYFLLNAYAEYKIKTYMKIFADAQNVTNVKFFDVRGYNSIPFLLNGGLTFSL